MKKGTVSFTVLMGLALSLMVLSGCQKRAQAGGQAASAATDDYGPNLVLTFGSTSAPNDLTTQGMEMMKKSIEEKSGGKITLNLFPASQLGPAVEQMEMVSDGSVDLFIEASSYLTTFGVKDAAAGNILFTYKTREEYRKVAESDLMKEWHAEYLRLNNIRIISNNWYRNFSSIISKKPLHTIDDLTGLKMRVPQVEMTLRTWQAVGVSPTPVAYNEMLLSLQQGVIDAAWLTQDAIYTMGLHEVAKNLLETKANTDCLMIFFNEDKYQAMTEKQRELVVAEAKAAGVWYSSQAEETLVKNNNAMKAAGVDIVSLSDAEWARFGERSHAFAREREAANSWTPGTFDRVLKILGR